jgi:hypothetical protein
MVHRQRQSVRKPATKFAHFQKKLMTSLLVSLLLTAGIWLIRSLSR